MADGDQSAQSSQLAGTHSRQALSRGNSRGGLRCGWISTRDRNLENLESAGLVDAAQRYSLASRMRTILRKLLAKLACF
jgi:hypothetical protein